MESLSKEKNLTLGLLLGMALAIAIPRAQPPELGASAEVAPAQQAAWYRTMVRAVEDCMNRSPISGQMSGDGGFLDVTIQTRC
jgi:hypothetical protein